MTKIYDIWVRAVLTSEKADNIPGLSGDVYKNIQFFRTVDDSPADFSDKQWKEKLEKLFQHGGVKVPEEGLEKKQKVSVTCKQLEGEQFQGKVEIPREYTGESPAYSVEDIY